MDLYWLDGSWPSYSWSAVCILRPFLESIFSRGLCLLCPTTASCLLLLSSLAVVMATIVRLCLCPQEILAKLGKGEGPAEYRRITGHLWRINLSDGPHPTMFSIVLLPKCITERSTFAKYKFVRLASESWPGHPSKSNKVVITNC